MRGALFAASASAFAATAHTLGGGSPPSPLFCLLLAALLLPVTTALAGPRPALWRTAAAMGAAQLAFHTAFAVVGDIGAWGPVTPHVHGAGDVTALIPTAGAAPDAAMTLGHAIAALAAVAVVHRGERAVVVILAWFPRAVRRLLAPVAPIVVRAPRLLAERAIRPARPTVPHGTLSRRGPPLLVGPAPAR